MMYSFVKSNELPLNQLTTMSSLSAFMGNRCSRFWTRSIVDYLTSRVALPISGALIAPYLDQNSRPVMVAMGLLRAILPFAASFQGSRVGRQLVCKWATVLYVMSLSKSFPPLTSPCFRFSSDFQHLQIC